ncbi:RHS repeat protein, partial [Natronospirillum operosum]
MQERLATLTTTRANLQNLLDDIEDRRAFYEGYLDHNFDFVVEAAENGLVMLDGYAADVQALYDDIDSRIGPLEQELARSQAHRDRNQYATDPAHRAEEEVGIDYLKWVGPTGDRLLFAVEAHGYRPIGVNAYQITEQGQGLEVQGSEGVRYRYNEHGLLMQQRDGGGGVVDVTRDSQQRITAISDQRGLSYAVSYNGARLQRITDPAGRELSFSYDGQGRLSAVNQFDGRIWNYAYEYAANDLAITRVTDGEGDTAEYRYREQDGKTVIDEQTDPAGHSRTYDYDFAGQRTVVHQRSAPADGRRIEYHYGDHNRVLEQTDLPSGDRLRYAYDDRGNRTRIIDELGGTTELAYDDRGNVTHQTDPEGRTTTFERDSAGRLIAVTDPAGHTTRYLRDSQGQVTEIQLPTGERIRQSWQDGLLQHRID